MSTNDTNGMLLFVTEKLIEDELKQVAEDLQGYIKVVVDIRREILTAGGTRHVDGEQLLLENGSEQKNLWGGGLDLETGEIDFDSMINIRTGQNNPSREVLSPEIRQKMEEIVHKFLR